MSYLGKQKIALAILWIITATELFASPEIQTINTLVKRVMETFQVPGVGIGIIKDGKVILSQGYGIANIDTGHAVNSNTVFKVASNSKAFTAVALAILVDQGKLNWQDKVIDYLPHFKMYDPWVTKEFNIIDLLTHRSGLRLGAGDLMLWPEPTKFSRNEVIENLRYLKPVSSFRDQYAYDNLLYIVAGEVVAAISGQSWEDFVESQIFKPLAMENCFAGGIDTTKHTNLVAPHYLSDKKLLNKTLKVDIPNLMNNTSSLMAAAGGIKCSVSDLNKWVSMLLNEGLMANGQPLISLQQRDTLWKVVTRLPISNSLKKLDRTHYRGYALGWRVSDFHGHWRVSHTGSLSGSMSQIIMLPDLGLSIIILTNQQSSSARNALARGILQEFTDIKKVDWVAYYKETLLKKSKEKTPSKKMASHIVNELDIPSSEQSSQLLGHYIDPWFGQISITKQANEIRFSSEKSPRLTGKLFYHKKNLWWVKWDDRSYDADAWLTFETNKDKVTRLTMKAISSATDFSFDFEDLNFTHQ